MKKFLIKDRLYGFENWEDAEFFCDLCNSFHSKFLNCKEEEVLLYDFTNYNNDAPVVLAIEPKYSELVQKICDNIYDIVTFEVE